MTLSDLENEIGDEDDDFDDMIPSPTAPAPPPSPPPPLLLPPPALPPPPPKHTFVNNIVSLLEDIDRFESDDSVTKSDMARDIRTKLLMAMRSAMVYPYTSFYSLQASTVMSTSAKT